MREDKIQAQIVKYLKSYEDRCVFFHVPNGGTRNIVEASKFKRIGVLPGVADLVLLFPGGRCVFIEVKNETGTQSQKQKEFEKRVKEMGFEYYLVRSVYDVMKLNLFN